MDNLKKDEEEKKEEIYNSCNNKWATGEAFLGYCAVLCGMILQQWGVKLIYRKHPHNESKGENFFVLQNILVGDFDVKRLAQGKKTRR